MAGGPGPAAAGPAALQKRLAAARSTGALDLAQCGLEHVPAEVFTCLLDDPAAARPAATVVDFNAPRGRGQEAWWEKADALVRLSLARNKLAALPERLAELGASLAVLDVSCNLLTSLPASLQALAALALLDASSNRIQQLPPALFGDPARGLGGRLTQLRLGNNGLRGLPFLALPLLDALQLEGNALSTCG